MIALADGVDPGDIGGPARDLIRAAVRRRSRRKSPARKRRKIRRYLRNEIIDAALDAMESPHVGVDASARLMRLALRHIEDDVRDFKRRTKAPHNPQSADSPEGFRE